MKPRRTVAQYRTAGDSALVHGANQIAGFRESPINRVDENAGPCDSIVVDFEHIRAIGLCVDPMHTVAAQ